MYTITPATANNIKAIEKSSTSKYFILNNHVEFHKNEEFPVPGFS